jgi:hypothetical protein
MAGGCCSSIRDLDNIVQTSLPNFVCLLFLYYLNWVAHCSFIAYVYNLFTIVHMNLIFICCFIAYNIIFRVAFITITVRLKMYLPRLLASQLHVWSLIYECLLLDNLHIIIIIIYKQQK